MPPLTSQPLSVIKTRRNRTVQVATKLQEFHAIKLRPSRPQNPIRVVCVSDTHNTRPALPPGDILIHAGDLTETGSFDEIQAGLQWLSCQAHTYKVFVAGNHDVLLDEDFLKKNPQRRYGQTQTRNNLDWGGVIYLQDSCITLEFPATTALCQETNHSLAANPSLRKISVFGSPWTPRYGSSAFQYHPDDNDHWHSRLSGVEPKPDIIVTHGPPKHHLDTRGFHRAGCPHLAEQIAAIRPRLAVFGHIHVAYGREDVVLDAVQRTYEEILTGWAGWVGVVWMSILVLWAKLMLPLVSRGFLSNNATIFVNAAVVCGPENKLKNEPIVVEL